MPDDGRSTSRNVASLNILVLGVINLLYYEQWTLCADTDAKVEGIEKMDVHWDSTLDYENDEYE